MTAPVRKRKRKVDASPKKDDPVHTTVSALWRIATYIGGAIIFIGSVWLAWNQIGLPLAASRDYVDLHIREAVHPIVTKLDDLGTSNLYGRLESLTGNREAALAQKSDLDLKTHTIKEPSALQIVSGQIRQVDDRLKTIDEKITDTKAELKRAQETRSNGK